MNTGDAAYIKKMNRRILMEELIKNGRLSRSELSRATGLNKATVSVQVNDLIEEGFFVERSIGETTTRGRKPILLEINRQAGFSIGIDIDADSLLIVFADFNGTVIQQESHELPSQEMEDITALLEELLTPKIRELEKTYTPHGLVGIGVGIHGIVSTDEQIVYSPRPHWQDQEIEQKLAELFQTEVHIDNNANLSVFAEQVYSEFISDLFCLTLYSGIGLGIIQDHNIYRGYQGFAGEIGHMIIQPDGKICACGNQGCWELYASERSLKQQLEQEYPLLTEAERIEKVFQSSSSEPLLAYYIKYLAAGVNNIINIFNPEKIVINGSIFNENPEIIGMIQEKLHSRFNHYREIRTSTIGRPACALGGAALALKEYFDIQIMVHHDQDLHLEPTS
ncbi:ROK family transcriptional regulator [Alkalicoccus urumqiensis]|uniref:ROK family transcriptional regulator n=1 Tax=Alkalicoccus urumqiensis TaxID=1548213 RepID=A0A2P6MJQ0_ALKUR|nr:ROK family transcriptional regulator [Alkalicoccus urumqiensis]PRO66493.1 hypothetical protein C6I21_03895 [Alkalicoccus urumqiensis]